MDGFVTTVSHCISLREGLTQSLASICPVAAALVPKARHYVRVPLAVPPPYMGLPVVHLTPQSPL